MIEAVKTFVGRAVLMGGLAAAAMVPVSGFSAEMVGMSDVPSGIYEVDKAHTSVTWKVSHLGLSDYTARFAVVDATLDYNAEDPTQSKLTAMVDPLSVKTDYPFADEKDFDKKLAEDESWFNGKNFSEIKFESKKITMTGERTAKVEGHLTMLGVEKPMTLDVTFNGAYTEKPFANVPALGFSAVGEIARSDWGFSTYVPNIGDAVKIMIETEFHKKSE